MGYSDTTVQSRCVCLCNRMKLKIIWKTGNMTPRNDLKERLNALRLYPNESYDSVIRRLSELAEDEEPLSKDTIERIEMSLKDIKEGRVYTTDEVKKRLKSA